MAYISDLLEMRLLKFMKFDRKGSKSVKFKIEIEENVDIASLSSQENQRGLILKQNI